MNAIRKTRRFLFQALAIVLFGPVISGSAATFNIANGDVAALNDAIDTCNSNHQNDTINLAANGTYILTAVDPRNTTSDSGLVEIRTDYDPPSTFPTLTINGNNATLMRSVAAGTPNFRLLGIRNEFSQGSSQATINNLSFVNGHSSGDGGAVLIDGTATLNNCTIRDNLAGGSGGGIWATYNVELNNCTIMNNTATQDGGGISNQNAQDPNNFIPHGGVLALTSCTLDGNFAQNGSGSGIYNKDIFVSGPNLATVDLISCTLSRGGIFNDGRRSDAKVTFANTLFYLAILENAVGPSGGGSIVSRGYNLTDDSSQGYFQQFTDRWNAVPNLDPAGPQDNGGPTPTMALCVGSDALDHGNKFGLTTDQRGFPRPVDNPSVGNTVDGTDIGAYEAPVDALQYGAPSFSVTTLADHDDGVCGAVDCTLREALARTNSLATGGSEAINFSPSVTGVLTLTGGELSIARTVNITGPGARVLTLSGGGQHRILSVLAGTVRISGLTFRDGFAFQGDESSSVGGGIYIEAALTVNDCTFSHNMVVGGDGLPLTGHEGGWGRGGAIFNGNILNLNRCTFTGLNAASGGQGGTPVDDSVIRAGGKGGSGLGGAVFNDVNGTLTVMNCSFFGNLGVGGAGADGAPVGGTGGAGGTGIGGIFNQGIMTMTSGTLNGNIGNGGAGGRGRGFFPDGVAGKGVGGVRAEAGMSGIKNSLIAGNTRNQTGGPDVDGAFTSGGFNLVGILTSTASGFTGQSDQAGTTAAPINPLLGPLQDNGGSTNTMALLTGSPAIDQGYWFNLNSDQRGQVRPKDHAQIPNATNGDGSDIGAFEDQTLDPAATPTPTPTATPTTTPVTTPNPSPTIAPTLTPIPTPPVTPTATPTGTPTATPVATPSPSPTMAPTLTPTPTPTPTANPTATPTTPTPTPAIPTPSVTPSIPTPTPTPSATASPISTPSPTVSASATPLATSTPSITPPPVTATPTASPAASLSPTIAPPTPSPTPSPTATPPGAQAINLSTRLRVQTGENVGIAGFIITGTSPKRVLLRGIGPSLARFNISDALADPLMELHGPTGFTTIMNNNWRDTQEDEIQATGIPPVNDLESAMVVNLVPGAYTAIVKGTGNTSGVALVEVYDLNQEALSKLANLSTRAFVGTGENIVIAGFLLNDNVTMDRIVVRGLGPSLSASGLNNVLADPNLELRDSNGALLISNNDWQDNAIQAAEIAATGLAPTNVHEPAIAAILPPGLYTALLFGSSNGTGVGIVEVYDRGAPSAP